MESEPVVHQICIVTSRLYVINCLVRTLPVPGYPGTRYSLAQKFLALRKSIFKNWLDLLCSGYLNRKADYAAYGSATLTGDNQASRSCRGLGVGERPGSKGCL
eukprot:2736998-Rhodomonas_salina.1